MVELVVNGIATSVDVDGRTTLLAMVRGLGLTGTHAGCEQGACGACTVLLDGATVHSCLVLAGQCGGREVTTIESLGTPAALHPVMEAFRKHHGLQCGFCTPGMVLAALEILTAEADPSEETIRAKLSGNLCRCTGYAGIVAAVRAAAHPT
ncbi:MAG: (2Fe-2S)-binding protein [Acidimicrobiales bacterium]